AAVRAGVGREQAHEAIKEHAVGVALAMRQAGKDDNDLLQRLAADPRLGLSLGALQTALGNPLDFVGAAAMQTQAFVGQVQAVVQRYPHAAKYQAEPML